MLGSCLTLGLWKAFYGKSLTKNPVIETKAPKYLPIFEIQSDYSTSHLL